VAVFGLLILLTSVVTKTRAREPKRPEGMPRIAWAAFMGASTRARIADADTRVTQTIGDHPESRGTHRVDGTLNGEPYCAAVDLTVEGLNHAKVEEWVRQLGECGFAAFYRRPPLFSEHIHAVYAGVPMKPVLKRQVLSYLEGMNGLRVPSRLPRELAPSESIRRSVARLLTNGRSH
jgi:hypothetical protein